MTTTARLSAGILLHRTGAGGRTEVLLGHMGGPFWARKDAGAWSIPKGEVEDGEEPEDAARREFAEELGVPVPEGPLEPLGTVRQSGGKTVVAWALRGDLDPDTVTPGTFELEWPRGSGQLRAFPEVDRVGWFDLVEAARLVVTAQRGLLARLPGAEVPGESDPGGVVAGDGGGG
ncbi:NUDIX domain-containing protein [Actinosynnema pretiosum subsp. pretiosum]|uniref:NUDIX hydrolase n=2 Tax=Actinosynnema TaxID=40566 RepID=C6W9T5_ACTMD|nr:NUDIX domain-containing protein [Actinosynnema mirum]ACU37302.1 NUDIX hydrolase [Actinosynnema mirum DSM 43827]AXX30775.1 MutT-like protein [Actinosynnema pretiosum subsp. pretiosum]QUF05110.1 NUDIX domain-containing protein [Actinosynnema pretiosum subsp. pretiosum]